MTRRHILLGSIALALRENKLDEAAALIEAQTNATEVSAATLLVRQGAKAFERHFGKAKSMDAIFLMASLTKPMTVSAVMVLVDHKELRLSDPVQHFIPEFRGEGKDQVLVKHLLTHTSGLPDMLANNVALRQRYAPLSDFVAGACATPLLFVPGTQWRYQSMGILLASEIVHRITRRPFPDFLAAQVFLPLQMNETSLGLGGRSISQTMQCQVPEVTSYDWNSSYWRNLASPWGGAHSTAPDIAKFLAYFAYPDGRVLKPETAMAMVTDQTTGLSRRWGLGWMLNNGNLGSGCSAATFGHSGSTGNLCWHDPKDDLSFVLLTTKPEAQSEKTLLHPVSEIASTSARI
jgi:CubicO group peptidase (beta-lactamase class C family)